MVRSETSRISGNLSNCIYVYTALFRTCLKFRVVQDNVIGVFLVIHNNGNSGTHNCGLGVILHP